VIRIAAVGDLHYGAGSTEILRPSLEHLHDRADVLLLAGDLTRCGGPEEVKVLADELRGVQIPVVAVLGNHDYHRDAQEEVAAVLRRSGVIVLEGDGAVLRLNGVSVGVAGVKGFGGGFAGACATDFGEPEMKSFVAATRRSADDLESALGQLHTDVRVALLHYAPVERTLVGEPQPLWPFLGSYLLAQAVDRAGADLVLHGHAHSGSAEACTPGGVPVLNVAQQVIHRPFLVVELDPGGASVTTPLTRAL